MICVFNDRFHSEAALQVVLCRHHVDAVVRKVRRNDLFSRGGGGIRFGHRFAGSHSSAGDCYDRFYELCVLLIFLARSPFIFSPLVEHLISYSSCLLTIIIFLHFYSIYKYVKLVVCKIFFDKLKNLNDTISLQLLFLMLILCLRWLLTLVIVTLRVKFAIRPDLLRK